MSSKQFRNPNKWACEVDCNLFDLSAKDIKSCRNNKRVEKGCSNVCNLSVKLLLNGAVHCIEVMNVSLVGIGCFEEIVSLGKRFNIFLCLLLEIILDEELLLYNVTSEHPIPSQASKDYTLFNQSHTCSVLIKHLKKKHAFLINLITSFYIIILIRSFFISILYF